MTRMTWLAGFGCVIMVGVTAAAEQRGSASLVPPPPSGISSGLTFAAPWRPDGSGGTQIVGTVIDIRQVPVAKVKVRLRNILTGEIVAESESNGNGEYSFPEVEPGTYVVEMFIDNRYIVALSNAGSIARNEIMQTVVMLPGRWDDATQTVVAPLNAGMFGGMSAATTMAAATMTAAQTENIPPKDEGVPLSPGKPPSP